MFAGIEVDKVAVEAAAEAMETASVAALMFRNDGKAVSALPVTAERADELARFFGRREVIGEALTDDAFSVLLGHGGDLLNLNARKEKRV